MTVLAELPWGGISFPCFFQCLEATHIPDLRAPLPIFKAHNSRPGPPHLLLLWNLVMTLDPLR